MAQPGDLSVDLHHVAVFEDVGAADVPGSRLRHGAGSGGDEVVQHVADRDGLDLVVYPLRRGHHRKAVGEVTNHFERRRTGADYHPGLQHDGLDAGGDEDLAHGGARGQVIRQFRALRMQAAEVDDAPYPGPAGRSDHVLGGATFLGREVLGEAHRVHQVVDDVDVVEGLLQGGRVAEVAAGHVDPVAPRDARQLVRSTGQRPNREPAFQQPGHQAAADVAGGTRHQAPLLLRGHPRLRSLCWPHSTSFNTAGPSPHESAGNCHGTVRKLRNNEVYGVHRVAC